MASDSINGWPVTNGLLFCLFPAQNLQDLCAGILNCLGEDVIQAVDAFQTGFVVLFFVDPERTVKSWQFVVRQFAAMVSDCCCHIFSAIRWELPSTQDPWHMPQDVWCQVLLWSLAGDAGKFEFQSISKILLFWGFRRGNYLSLNSQTIDTYWILGLTRRNAKISSQNRCAIGASLLKAIVDNYEVFLL